MKKAQYSVADTIISVESEVISNYVSLRLAQEKLKITPQKEFNL